MDNIFYKKILEDTSYLQIALNNANEKIKCLMKQINEMESADNTGGNLAGGVAPPPPPKEIPKELHPYIPADPFWKPPPGYKDPRQPISPFEQNPDIPQIGEYDPYRGIDDPDLQNLEYQRLLQNWINEYIRLYGWDPWVQAYLQRLFGNRPSGLGGLWQGMWEGFQYWFWHEFMPGHGHSFPGIYGDGWQWNPGPPGGQGFWQWSYPGSPQGVSPDEWFRTHPPPPAPWDMPLRPFDPTQPP